MRKYSSPTFHNRSVYPPQHHCTANLLLPPSAPPFHPLYTLFHLPPSPCPTASLPPLPSSLLSLSSFMTSYPTPFPRSSFPSYSFSCITRTNYLIFFLSAFPSFILILISLSYSFPSILANIHCSPEFRIGTYFRKNEITPFFKPLYQKNAQ